MTLSRRTLMQAAGAGLFSQSVLAQNRASANVVIIGGGFAGATAAKYLKRFNPRLSITLIEPNDAFIMCPMSNRVITGSMNIRDITRAYSAFTTKYGIKWIHAAADAIDPDKRQVRVGKDVVSYDKLIVAPGIDFNYDAIGGMGNAAAQLAIPHAWKAGEQTRRLKDQLYAMPPGGVIAMHIPKVPYRCPPGPYERASLLANFLKSKNPKAKLFVFDSNPDIQAKKGLFEKVWKTNFPSQLEYIPNASIESVDVATKTMTFEVLPKLKADVLNIIPPQRCGPIASRAGLASVDKRWCGVDFLSYASLVHPDIHVLGDSIASPPGMPKSGHMANQEAKVCAAAIAAWSLGQAVPSMPIIANTCYSFVSETEAMHVTGVYRYDAAKKTMAPVPGAGGLSVAPTLLEGIHAMGWAGNILADSLE
ncbi:MAG: FAD-dependent oxidoreductase [Rhodoferax sp.]|nr:FAD-dependent oxidoreductase [Rhodoferax sp.]